MSAFYHAAHPQIHSFVSRNNVWQVSPSLITIGQAREHVRRAIRPLEPERAQVGEALDRVLVADLKAALDVPAFPSSAMDGYAVKDGPAGRELAIAGESRAGAPAAGGLGHGQAIRISTGAAVPAGATAVIRQEDVDEHPDSVTLNAPVSAGENIRAAGEVMRAGAAVLAAGTTLGAPELAAAIAAGAGEVLVARRPLVQVLCTGDELREPGEPLGPGEIHNSNGAMLVALASRSGAVTLPALKLPDDRAATEAGLARAVELADVVIISGGVSVGPHDHVKPALAALGVREWFWGVALQPGKPTWFGTRDGTAVFGLPGNPVSAAVTFALFARPALLALQGRPDASPRDQRAELGVAVARNRRRDQALRVRLERAEGRVLAIPNGPQGSHIVTSLVGADALALIPMGEGTLKEGTVVALEPLPR
jgi:molybdopterin molybdotransferase